MMLTMAIFASLFALPIWPHAAALSEKDVIFIGANGKVLELSPATTALFQNNIMYIPASVFTGYLGCTFKISSDGPILSKGRNTIGYDLGKDMVAVTSGSNVRSFETDRPVYKNGIWYLPAEFACETLNIFYPDSYYPSVPLIYTDVQINAPRDDLNFFAGFMNTFRAKLKAYLAKMNKTDNNGSINNNQQETAAKPTPTPAVPVRKNLNVYLFIGGTLDSYTSDVLSILSEYGCHATFIVQGNQAAANESLLREIVCRGSTLAAGSYNGASLNGTAEQIVANLDETNTEIYRILKMKVRMAYINGGSKAMLGDGKRDALIAAGYRIWDSQITAYTYGKSRSNAASDTIDKLKRTTGTVVVSFDSGPNQAAVLSDVLKYLKEAGANIVTADYLKSPVNQILDKR